MLSVLQDERKLPHSLLLCCFVQYESSHSLPMPMPMPFDPLRLGSVSVHIINSAGYCILLSLNVGWWSRGPNSLPPALAAVKDDWIHSTPSTLTVWSSLTAFGIVLTSSSYEKIRTYPFERRSSSGINQRFRSGFLSFFFTRMLQLLPTSKQKLNQHSKNPYAPESRLPGV